MFHVFSLFSESGLSFWERVAAWYEKSLLKELVTYFGERYFSVEFGVYENFSLGQNASVTARNMILAVAVGLIVASIMTAYLRMGHGGFVRKLLAEDCTSPEKAKTLSELGYFRSSIIRRELTRGTVLRMVVRCREEELRKELATTNQKGEVEKKATEDQSDEAQAVLEEQTPSDGVEAGKPVLRPFRPDFLTAHFYIPEELRYRAEIRFEAKGSGWLPLLIVVVLTVIAASALCYFLPDVVAFADNLISFFSP